MARKVDYVVECIGVTLLHGYGSEIPAVGDTIAHLGRRYAVRERVFSFRKRAGSRDVHEAACVVLIVERVGGDT